MRLRQNKRRALITALGIALIALAAGRWGRETAREEMFDELMRDVAGFAAAFDAEEVSRLSGTRGDLNSPDYEAVKRRLMRFRAIDSTVRFVYIFRQIPGTPRVIFLADSELPESPEISQPGDEYTEAAQSPGLQEILRTGRPAIEGPLSDEFGTWVTAYAALTARPDGAREVLGIDVAARQWQDRLWTAGLQAALYVLVLLGLPLVAYLTVSRQLEQNAVIRNLFEAMEQSPSAVMILDLGWHIEYANTGLCRQIGHARRDLIGRPWRDFLLPDLPVEQFAEMKAMVRAGQSWNAEWSNRRHDGSRYPVRCSVTPVNTHAGELACFVAVFEDMTAVKRNEAALREALEQAEAGDRAKGQFLAMMSHEVRTPLNGIVGFTKLLMDTPLTVEQLEYMQTIHQSAEALIQLTSDILDFARIESGKFKLEPERCDPRACLEDALDLLATRAADKHLELLHWVDAEVPAAVWTDSGRLQQVIINLVNNAVKFTDAGVVETTLTARRLPSTEGAAPEWELQFTVRDTGPGIAPDQQQRLFMPFTQGENASTRKHGGSGLGLAISRNLVQLMGGKIGLQSELGHGSAFTFTVRAPEMRDEAPAALVRLDRLRVVMEIGAVGLGRELRRLTEAAGAAVTQAPLAGLAAADWDVALVDLDLTSATKLATLPQPRDGYPRDKLIGLVPLSLAPSLRPSLHVHFRQLVNKPVHHQTLLALMATPLAAAAPAVILPAPTHFKLTVLLVEDNAVNQRLMQLVLTKLGCQWDLASNGRLALEALARRDFDVVLMDLHMPEMDGPTAIAEIRRGGAGERMRGVWIIALTADAREDQRVRVLAGGANDYLTKPLKPNELADAFRRLLAAGARP